MASMDDPIRTQNRLCTAALDAESAGRPADAVRLYRQAISVADRNPLPYLFLGYALEQLQQDSAAVQAWSLAADLDPRVVNAWRDDGVPADVQLRSRAADRAIRSHFTEMHKATIAHYKERHPQADVARIEAAIWCQTHDAEVEFRSPRQIPQLFFVPDLAPIAVYGPEHMPWYKTLEAAWKNIRSEFVAAQELAGDEQRPYLNQKAASHGEDWQRIAGSLNWGSFHLYKQGVANRKLVELFPATLHALESVPLIMKPGGPSEVLFSVLRGGQRIPSHFGVANTDMTVHLPIITTDKSAIRVVDEVHPWKAGKVFAFDDAFEHESWNDSEDVRVNLLFEAWHPDLTLDEQCAIVETFEAREKWSRERCIQPA